MPDYDFRSLSDYDFEILVRDLLQKELRIRLESFARGRDGGIDFRYKDPEGTLVVQCKHYADYDQLLRGIKNVEVKKLARLQPKRYILAVSTPLTPGRKDALLQLLSPYTQSTHDIFGREDLNNLLGRFPEIEQKNLKLWLTSEPVLSRVLHSGIWGDAELTIQRIRRRASIYVPNPSYRRAKQILEDHRHCIIAGIPGIGKTTLAEVLLIDYVDKHGFQAVRIANDLAEIKAVKKGNEKQIFYFDDFLGTTALDKLQRNEDKRLLEFMEEVSENPNWRFILTTREYILNAARLRYESFTHAASDLVPCIIELADYTALIRAKILYNHIYFSDLQVSYKLALLENNNYLQIINHANYNPRIVEHMTKAKNAEIVEPDKFFEEFISNLDNPARVWDHAFRNQLGESSQHLLLVMVSMPDEILLTDLREAFGAFYQKRKDKLGFAATGRDFENAIKALDGNFIKTMMLGDSSVVEFHNPSVRDFLEQYLMDNDDVVGDLVNASQFFDQLQRLWRGKRGKRFAGIVKYGDAFVQRLRHCISSPDCAFLRLGNFSGALVNVHRRTQLYEDRVAFVVEVSGGILTENADAFVRELIQKTQERVNAGDGSKPAFLRLLEKVRGSEFELKRAEMVEVAEHFFSQRLDDLRDYKVLVEFTKSFPNLLSETQVEDLRSEFIEFCEQFSAASASDPDDLRRSAREIEIIAEAFDVEVDGKIEELRERANEWEEENNLEHEPDDPDEDWEPPAQEAESLNDMFDRLRDELDG